MRLALVSAALICAAVLGAEIQLEVTGGNADVSDWIAEAALDLAAARTLLGASGRHDRIAVYELDGAGGGGAPVASQVDASGSNGIYVVAWRVPGKLAGGARRTFAVRFGSPEPVVEERAVSVAKTENGVAVSNGEIALEHSMDYAGMIRHVTVGGTGAALTWNDYVYDGTVYRMAHRRAERTDVVVNAGGPLRAKITVTGRYIDGHTGKMPASKPRAVYRFTSYAGLPFTRVEADVTQEHAHQWTSLNFIEAHIGEAAFTHFCTDRASGALAGNSEFRSGKEWVSVHNEGLLMGMCASENPGIYVGGGEKGYGSYVRSGVSPMTALSRHWTGTFLWGAGTKAVERKMVQRWNDVLSNPPTVRIALDVLEERVAAAARTLEQKESALANLSGKAWASSHVAVTLSRVQAVIARERLLTGRFRGALSAIEACKRILDADAGEARLLQEGTIRAGIVMGHPYLGNDKAVYLWSRPEHGAGLISIFDREAGREYLKIEPSEASFWYIAAKNGTGGAGFASKGTPCQVTFDADEKEGRMHLRWSGGMTVAVEARLAAHDPLLRATINANTESATHGLVAVTFPMINGIAPLTREAREDVVLHTRQAGWAKPSPLVSGKVVSTKYPFGMNFTALIGGGLGLYLGEEDGQANRKELTWAADKDTESLRFSIAHPVLNWGAEDPVGEYGSPGDFVCGPFRGDWYDAARIYRKWALGAPWCAKGPIYEREDYPKWLMNAPYWTIAHVGDETGIQNEFDKHAFYEIPTMIAHTYGYWLMPHQDDRYPEHWPPKLGSEGFKRMVEQFQAKGIRVVPYVQGWIWDEDTESFRTKDVRNKGALWPWEPTAKLITMTAYGGGQKMTGMCPASRLWRDEMSFMVKELVGRYGVDGVYFDFLTVHTNDCYNEDHGHAICGGNYWTKAVHGLYEECRATAKRFNPDAMLTGEDVAEYCIDVHDTFLCRGPAGTPTPLFAAVYHGYANLYGGDYGEWDPMSLGRWWLQGSQSGWTGLAQVMIGKPPFEQYAASGRYYRKLLTCRWEFANPYLGYGEMLRPPKIEGDIPEITRQSPDQGPFSAQIIEGSAWKAPDGTVGVFFLNYDETDAHTFTWTTDLAEIAGIGESMKIRISRWTPGAGLAFVKEAAGGVVAGTIEAKPLDIIALKLEVVR